MNTGSELISGLGAELGGGGFSLSTPSSATSGVDGNNIYFGNNGGLDTEDIIKYTAVALFAVLAIKLIKKR